MIAVLVVMAGYFCVQAYQDYRVNRLKVEAMTRQYRLLKTQAMEIRRQKRLLERVGAFIGQAGSLGLDTRHWAYYNVNIQETMMFHDLERVLSQSGHTDSYYFRPSRLHIKSKAGLDEAMIPVAPSAEGETPAQAPVEKAAPADDKAEGDVQVTLRGAFVVRHK